MIGWLISLLFIISGIVTKDSSHFIVAGLFSISGTISVAAWRLDKKN